MFALGLGISTLAQAAQLVSFVVMAALILMPILAVKAEELVNPSGGVDRCC